MEVTTQIAEPRNREDRNQLDAEQAGQRVTLHPANLASARVHIIIPVLNEAPALQIVLPEIAFLNASIIVVDNGSTDGSASVAQLLGATVVHEPRRGYGAACLRGIATLSAVVDDDVVLFMDGDASDDPRDLPKLLQPLFDDTADLVIGSRTTGRSDAGALPPHARFGNWLATYLIARKTGVRYTDLGPLRALRVHTLKQLQMQDRAFGWTVEMQLKATQQRLRIAEVPVHYRRRIGKSKISGTLMGSLRAGYTILRTIARHGR